MPRVSDFMINSADGTGRIFCREYCPDEEPVGVVQIVHGLSEHIDRYDDLARFLCAHRYVVAGNDHPGHGRSIADPSLSGVFPDNDGFGSVLSDIQKLHMITAGKYPGIPYYLLGHSLGSILVRAMLIRYGEGLDGAVLCGTCQQRESVLRPLKLLCAAEIRRHGRAYRSEDLFRMLLTRFSRPFGKNSSPYAWLSRDSKSVLDFENDPLCGATPSIGLIYDVLGGMEFVSLRKNMSKMRRSIPVIFISGDCDPFGEHGRGVIRAYKGFLRSGLTDVTLKLYHEGRHEILNEINREEVYLDLVGWLNKNAGVI